jgi:hypothetical protein
VFVHSYLHEDVILEKLFRSRGLHYWWYYCFCKSLVASTETLFFYFLFSAVHPWCLDLMSRLSVFDIILILIYSLYQKKNSDRKPPKRISGCHKIFETRIRPKRHLRIVQWTRHLHPERWRTCPYRQVMRDVPVKEALHVSILEFYGALFVLF